ncbi:hypothetical protein BH24GEM3_BH24GEM3_22410 [soil metagenome]
MDEPERQPRRALDRLRPAGRHLPHPHRRRRGAAAHLRASLRSAPPLQPERARAGLRQRPRRGGQPLAHGYGRLQSPSGHAGEGTAPHQSLLVAGCRLPGGEAPCDRHPLAGRGRDLALSHAGREGRAAGASAGLHLRHQRARLLRRRALGLLQPLWPLRVQPQRARGDLPDLALRPGAGHHPARHARPRRRGAPHPLAGREAARFRAAHRAEDGAGAARPRAWLGAGALRQPRSRPDGDLDAARRLPRLRLDAGLATHRNLLRRQDQHSRGGERRRAGDPLHRPRLSPDDRDGALRADPGERGELPGASDPLAGDHSRWQAPRLSGGGAHLADAAPRRPPGAGDGGGAAGVRPRDLTRQTLDRLHHLERQPGRRGVEGAAAPRPPLRAGAPHHARRSVRQSRLVARREAHRLRPGQLTGEPGGGAEQRVLSAAALGRREWRSPAGDHHHLEPRGEPPHAAPLLEPGW